MIKKRSLENWWDWFSGVEEILASRRALVATTRTALAQRGAKDRAALVLEIERQIAEIDEHALSADELRAALDDADAVRALESVSRKLDRLSVQLSGLIVPHAKVATSLRAL